MIDKQISGPCAERSPEHVGYTSQCEQGSQALLTAEKKKACSTAFNHQSILHVNIYSSLRAMSSSHLTTLTLTCN